MRIYFLHDDHESGPYSIRDVRDRLDLRMIAPSQACRIGGRDGRYVAGEIVSGEVFRSWDEQEDEDDDGPEDDLVEDDEDSEELEEEDNDEEEEEELELDSLWTGHPGLGRFPVHFTIFFALVGLSGVAWLWDWSGWMAAGFAALACFTFAMLLARRQGTRYELHSRRAQSTSGFVFQTIREVPRQAVEAIDVRVGVWAGLRGRGDVVFHWTSQRGMEELVFRDVFRPSRVRGLWRE